MNLFIDTNIYLNFYHYTSEDLEELRKLAVAIRSGNIILFLTQQIMDEFARNREFKIADALKQFNKQKVGCEFPQMCREYEEYAELRDAVRRFDENKEAICTRLLSDIENKSLEADKVISELFAMAKLFEHDDDILSAAKTRVTLGNPPGNEKSFGDAVNWETVLTRMPDEELFFITRDSHFFSPIDDTRLAEFLVREWDQRKKTKIFLYGKLSDFFRDKYPSIKLASELERELAISEFATSTNFNKTHLAVAKLLRFTDFTDEEINEIVEAFVSNRQIYWISADADIRGFMQKLIVNFQAIIVPERLAVLKTHYPEAPAAF